MVKTVQIALSDEDYYKIIQKKGARIWRDFLLEEAENED